MSDDADVFAVAIIISLVVMAGVLGIFRVYEASFQLYHVIACDLCFIDGVAYVLILERGGRA